MLDIARNLNIYPMLSNNAFVMSIGSFTNPAPSMGHNPVCCSNRSIVKAGSPLAINALSDVIDVVGLSQDSPPVIQYVIIFQNIFFSANCLYLLFIYSQNT